MLNGLCGMRLNTAGVLIGWIGAALSLLSIIVFALCLGRLDELAKLIVDNINDPTVSEESVRRVVLIIATLYITINVINCVASALLIVGTIKERHLLIVPWLLNSGVSLFCSAIYFLYFVFISISMGAPFGSVALTLISTGISLTLHFIIWYAVYSLFKQLQAGREQQQLLRSTGSSYPSYTKI